jgi:hypothetical protein
MHFVFLLLCLLSVSQQYKVQIWFVASKNAIEIQDTRFVKWFASNVGWIIIYLFIYNHHQEIMMKWIGSHGSSSPL